MSELQAFLHLFDAAWNHSYESLQSALDGVTQAEAVFQAACYANEPREAGWPLPGSIAWQVAHLIDCKDAYTRHFARALGEVPHEDSSWQPAATWEALLAQLEAAHQAERGAIAALRPDMLDEVAGNGMTYREFLAMVIRHDTWHASQAALARRLFRA